MIRLLALGVLGYAGYRYYEKNVRESTQKRDTLPSDSVAGGPLSDKATVQHTADLPAG